MNTIMSKLPTVMAQIGDFRINVSSVELRPTENPDRVIAIVQPGDRCIALSRDQVGELVNELAGADGRSLLLTVGSGHWLKASDPDDLASLS
jgi:hypothetical protein